MSNLHGFVESSYSECSFINIFKPAFLTQLSEHEHEETSIGNIFNSKIHKWLFCRYMKNVIHPLIAITNLVMPGSWRFKILIMVSDIWRMPKIKEFLILSTEWQIVIHILDPYSFEVLLILLIQKGCWIKNIFHIVIYLFI